MKGKWERARGMDWEAEVDASFYLSGKLMSATPQSVNSFPLVFLSSLLEF